MTKQKTTSRALVPIGETRIYPTTGTEAEATQMFPVLERHPSGNGPLQHKPDKPAWVNASTGLAFTILRQANDVLGR